MAVLAIVLGGVLLMLPTAVVSVGMARDFGWRHVGFMWAVVLSTMAFVFAGAWLLHYGIKHV